MAKFLIIFVALNGALATGLAAFASHSPQLQGQPYLLEVFTKANSQHFIHILACLVTALVAYFTRLRSWLVASCLFALGITLFSYTLYLFTFTGAKIAGFLTPIGGVCFILGWLSIVVATWHLVTPVNENK